MPLRAIALLICAGIFVGMAEPHKLSYAFGQSTLYVFLPPLLFEAAWNLELAHLRAHWKPIMILAVPGVIATMIAVAVCTAMTGFP